MDTFTDKLAELDAMGISPWQVGIAIGVVLLSATVFIFAPGSGGGTTGGDYHAMDVDLHPEHLKYMRRKEAQFCSSDFGKGLRCIFDYLRELQFESEEVEVEGKEEEKNDTTTNSSANELMQQMLTEPPKYVNKENADDYYETHHVLVYPPQFTFFEKQGIQIHSDVPGEEWHEMSRVCRSLFDWAIRKEAEGDSQDKILFGTIRCVNC
mmetsp:Transcript_47283/g.54605  ORF Transcript_47283/g.54605 Transcript_47283/m.54605 type:complete len:209 (+) Transcript_47283:212-838(+)